jgi:hypothetical protein
MAEKKAPSGKRRKPGSTPRQTPYLVTTIRLEQRQWRWLREEALRRALQEGGKADASVIVRELIDRAIGSRQIGAVSVLAVTRERLREGLPKVSPGLLKRPARRR